ncbi:hypothetical protein [Geothermobacter hydrogeniphilus]|uniref:Uncharacterized protein n=1 Tax=Geothermobacter hydrogeniphilus TaxID=1969733 RepID=A0A1X0Y3P3_9BACT|nr:hypothetical protein [Geothermobacter hydrogeniphilus]ORJ59790.1 hypothetical protein B5V00_08935 [Geothermobacter hydrogeniphilus]
MNRGSALLATAFAAGLLGGLCNSLALWLAGDWGLTALLGVKIAPHLTPAWLYPRLVWGGIWGLVFYFTIARPRARRHWVRKGLWISLLPSAVQLFIIFPNTTHFGMLGFGLGQLTPLVVLLANAVWGLFTGVFTRALWGRG